MNELEYIKQLLLDNKTDEAIARLDNIIATTPNDDNVYFLLGNAYRKKNAWREALNAYCQAIEINPESPAKLAYEQTQEILAFFNHDLYNP